MTSSALRAARSEGALRIVQLTPYALDRPGGVQGQVVGLARELGRLGHEVLLASPGPTFDPRILGVVSRGVGRVREVRGNGSVAPLALSPGASLRLRRVARRFEPDVVHLHEPLAPFVGYSLFLRPVAPTIATFHRFGDPGPERLVRPLLEWGLSHLDLRVAVSDAARRSAIASVGGAYEVAFNGVEVGPPSAPTKSADRIQILFVGRHEPRKGLSVILEAFELLVRTAGDDVAGVSFEVVGDGPTGLALREQFGSIGAISWLGRLGDEELREHRRRAHIVVAPSMGAESFGVVLLEAMAATALVLASDISGYREAAGGHATLVAPGDPHAWRDALALAIRSVRTKSAMASLDKLSAARHHAEERSIVRLARFYETRYREILRTRR